MNKRVNFVLLAVMLSGFLPDFTIRAQDQHHHVESITPELRNRLSDVILKYIDLENAIFSGDTKTAVEKATVLENAVSSISPDMFSGQQKTRWQQLSQSIQKTTKDLVSQNELEQQRKAFLEISNAAITILKDFGPLNDGYYLFHCPMAARDGGHWLANTDAVANPYFGKAMANCGTLVETFAKFHADQK